MKSKNWQWLQAKIPITQFLLPLLFSAILLFSCKKEISYDEIENLSVESFLKLPENAPPELKTVTSDLRKQLEEKNFVKDFITWNGKPSWDKAIKLVSTIRGIYTIIVPSEKGKITSSFFAATVEKDGTVLFEMHRKGLKEKNTEFSYIQLTDNKINILFNWFENKSTASVQNLIPPTTNNAQPPYCWWVYQCGGTNTNAAVIVPCRWVEHCIEVGDDGGTGNGGGGGGSGGCTICPPPPCYTSLWYSNNVLPEGCGHGWGENSPGDRLCSGSFNLRSGNDNSFWETNMTNLKFEDAAGNVNNFSAYFDLHNGMKDFTMNEVIYPSPYGTGVPPKSALEYLHDFFPDLFTSGDITSLWENGILIWRFSKYAAQKIVTKCSNTAGFSVTLQYPGLCAQSGFIPAQTSFRSQAQALIRCFMPTSVCRLSPSASSNVSYASYSPLCN